MSGTAKLVAWAAKAGAANDRVATKAGAANDRVATKAGAAKDLVANEGAAGAQLPETLPEETATALFEAKALPAYKPLS